MKINDFIEGLKIIQKYEPNAEIEAQHDVIYIGSDETLELMSSEDRERLESLNWYDDEDSLCCPV